MELACCACRYWTVGLSGVSVAAQAITVAATTVVIDSGTSAILLGPDDSNAIHAVRAAAFSPPVLQPKP